MKLITEGTPHFIIKAAHIKTSNTGYRYEINVTVIMPSGIFNQYKKKKHLGMLYGVDISNEAYKTYGIPMQCPTVDDKARASQGLKTIKLTHFTDSDELAQTLGIKGRLSRTGAFWPAYASTTEIKERSAS